MVLKLVGIKMHCNPKHRLSMLQDDTCEALYAYLYEDESIAPSLDKMHILFYTTSMLISRFSSIVLYSTHNLGRP